ncbi:AraC family transcriptional regulator [Brevundimonas faecalis]|uniref:AraC-like DNA-binding protein n=1 Tax=Brevundimonas faecalis TaxID=947378 RepID=A0ABV2R9Y7_9CAUL
MKDLNCDSDDPVGGFDPDRTGRRIAALGLDIADHAEEIPVHRHRQGQLVFARQGAVTCRADGGSWIVPAGRGVWIPGGVAHSNRATANARLAFLFVEPGAAALPDRCCTLAVSPMVREMIAHLADRPQDAPFDARAERLEQVLLDELAVMPREDFGLPGSEHRQVGRILAALTADPADRRTQAEWAREVGASERALTRLMLQETGMTFGRWRQRLHLAVALRELASGASVQRTAEDLGYASTTAFITMFKKATGRTPARFFAPDR